MGIPHKLSKGGLGDVREGSESSTPAENPAAQFSLEVNTCDRRYGSGLTRPAMGCGNPFSKVLPTRALRALIVT